MRKARRGSRICGHLVGSANAISKQRYTGHMALEKSKLDRAVDYAMAQASAAEDISALSEAVRTVAIIWTAQGIIDNGGLQYFFESDFPGRPPYSIFVEAYRAIGADEAASALADAVALFPFAEPHRDAAKRNQFMDSFNGDDDEAVNSPFEQYTNLLCGNGSVWPLVKAYVEKNINALGG